MNKTYRCLIQTSVSAFVFRCVWKSTVEMLYLSNVMNSMFMSIEHAEGWKYEQKKTLIQKMKKKSKKLKRARKIYIQMHCITTNIKMHSYACVCLCVWEREYRAALCLVNVLLNDGVYIFFLYCIRFVFGFCSVHDFILVLAFLLLLGVLCFVFCFFLYSFFGKQYFRGRNEKGDVVGSNHTT